MAQGTCESVILDTVEIKTNQSVNGSHFSVSETSGLSYPEVSGHQIKYHYAAPYIVILILLLALCRCYRLNRRKDIMLTAYQVQQSLDIEIQNIEEKRGFRQMESNE